MSTENEGTAVPADPTAPSAPPTPPTPPAPSTPPTGREAVAKEQAPAQVSAPEPTPAAAHSHRHRLRHRLLKPATIAAPMPPAPPASAPAPAPEPAAVGGGGSPPPPPAVPAGRAVPRVLVAPGRPGSGPAASSAVLVAALVAGGVGGGIGYWAAQRGDSESTGSTTVSSGEAPSVQARPGHGRRGRGEGAAERGHDPGEVRRIAGRGRGRHGHRLRVRPGRPHRHQQPRGRVGGGGRRALRDVLRRQDVRRGGCRPGPGLRRGRPEAHRRAEGAEAAAARATPTRWRSATRRSRSARPSVSRTR
ncbi:hypothetical protein SNARM312S_06060 [Streptomyces narbonensis]